MTDTTNLGTVWVVGQRRRPNGTFPPASTGGGGGLGEDGGIQQDEIDPDGSGPDGPALDPCSNPATALDWNADAAAAEAKRQFEAKAQELGDDGLYEREFGAQIYQRADGSIYLGPVTYGDPMTGTFGFDESGATQGNLVGEIHSHPGGNLVPSAADWARLDHWSGWTGRNFRSYVVARDPADPNSEFRIRVYDTTSDRDIDAIGPEVNPEATQCSA